MLKYKCPGIWDASRYKGLYYVHARPNEANPGYLVSGGGVDTCREFYVRRYRQVINKENGFTPWARKAYCLMTYGHPHEANFKAWHKGLQEDAEKGLYIINSFEKVHKWSLTKLYPVKCDNGTPFVFFSGPRKWTTSPYLLSIWSLCIRLGRNDWLPAKLMTLNNEDLIRQMVIAAKPQREGSDSDSTQVVSTIKQWNTFLSLYKDLFGGKSRKYHWDTDHLSRGNDRPEGIRKLLDNSTEYTALCRKYNKLKKEKKLK